MYGACYFSLGDSETESGTETESDSESYVEDSQPHTATQTLGKSDLK